MGFNATHEEHRVYVLSRFNPRGYGRPLIAGLLLAFALFLNSAGSLMAGTTGTISGTITDAKTGNGIANVKVAAVAPTARYSTVTDGKGFYAFTGVEPDTYTLSFELTGYQPSSATGVNVFADQVSNVTLKLEHSLVTIGRVTARSTTGAYQPTQTQDTYTLNTSQIDTQLGQADNVSETALIVSLPGASLDSSGYPVIRGGRENEEGFQYEGIPYTDAFTNQFVNSLALNGGVQSVQLTPGAGDASTGNSGTGTLNLIAKRGARPSFGQVDLEAVAQPYSHHLQAEYGFATPNGRVSNYISFLGTRDGNQYGPWGAPAASVGAGAFYGTSFTSSGDLTDNFFYKFGRDNNQSIQVFYQNQMYTFSQNYGGIGTLCFITCDKYALANLNDFNFGLLSNAQIQEVTGLDPYQTSPTQMLNRYDTYYQPNDTFKVQYSNNIDASTYVTTKFYKVNSVVTFDFPNGGQTYTGNTSLQGGQSTGTTLDATKQLNSKNLLKLGGQWAFLHPVYNFLDPEYGELALSGFGSGAFEVFDFLPNNNPNSPCLASSVSLADCGYIYNKFNPNNEPRIPAFLETTGTNRQDYAGYLNDTFTASDRLKIDGGLRLDGTNYRIPSVAPCNAYNAQGQYLDDPAYGGGNNCMYAHNAFDSHGNPITVLQPDVKNPNVIEPRLAVSFQLTRNDALRASYGRSVEFAPLGDIDWVVSRDYYTSRYGKIPPNPDSFPVCGVTGSTTCSSYGDQLYWENQNEISGVPYQPVKPETFNNYDFSYSHEFSGNVGLKLTPFYRRGYDAIALTQTVKTNSQGQPILDAAGGVQFNPSVATNDGQENTSGIEFLVTKDAAYGLTGSFSATYINEFSNVPPLSDSEDFFPSIPPASLALGNLYRVGFLSPFQATLAVAWKSHFGLKINPVISYNKGYPIGNGVYTATYINNVAYNVPNTNVTNPDGSTAAQLYVDPQNPGSMYHPNIAAYRGGGLGPSPGASLSSAQFMTNLGIEFKAPGSKSTFGVYIANLFNQLYAQPPGINSRYQPVATNIAGPITGQSSLPLDFPGEGFANWGSTRQGSLPYLFSQYNEPTTFRFYYQLGL
jgi:Carboxypeptidase regulatory-like domain/TonB dependent receptor